MDKIQIVAIIGSFFLIVFIIELIRRGRLKEKYSLIWIASGGTVLLFSLWRDLLDIVSRWFGIAYPPSLLFLVAFMFLLLIVLHFSIVISSLSERNKRLAQEIALMKMYGKHKENEG